MGAFSFWHILIVAAVVILLFGRGKISELMGDVAKGIKSFKKGLSEDETTAAAPPPATPPRAIDHEPVEPVRVEKAEERSKVG
ncbi:twin-arginine translocase TatA/TatE family subunit [Pseudoxanthobacter sp. M-2]|uniref:twin-arginine translocase TatA/TatE family subunit n=1 Tax=Pseudoxanthobacter sp. M-2 TaxID=3078754 RepID=UPI0038FC1DF0